MERDRHDRIEPLIERQSASKQVCQGTGQSLDPGVLIKMNQLAQDAVVGRKTVRRIEAPQAAPAQRASAVRVQRKLILKRGPASGAEELCAERLRGAKAPPADRVSQNFAQIFAAYPAGIGEKEGKKGVGD